MTRSDVDPIPSPQSKLTPTAGGESPAPAAAELDRGVQWMLAFQAGDEPAFDALVGHYRIGVFHFILSSLKDAGRAEDLTQETFLRVYRSRGRYQATARFKTWLFTIANRLVLNEIRALRRRRRVIADAPRAASGDEGEELFWNSVADPDAESPVSQAERKELTCFLESMIASLPENQRAALQLHRSEDLSYRDIASVLNVSPMAVKSLLVRAREKLKEGLEHFFAGGDASHENAPTDTREGNR